MRYSNYMILLHRLVDDYRTFLVAPSREVLETFELLREAA